MYSFVNKTRSLSLAALLIVATLACKDELNPVTTTDLNLETTSLGGNTKGVSVPRPGVWPVVNKTTSEAPAG